MIGHGQPFCLIGERINPTGRRIFQEQLRAGDLSAIERDVKAQVEGGADVLDVNMGVPLTDEPELLAKAIADRPVADRPADLHRLLGRRGARGRALGLPGPGAGQLDHRRGRPDGRDPPAGQEVRRRGHRAAQRPRRDPDGGRQAPRAHRARSSASPRRSTASPRDDIVIDPLAMPIGADTDGGHDHAGDDAPDPRRVRRQHDLRRLQRVVRHARPARAQRASCRWR